MSRAIRAGVVLAAALTLAACGDQSVSTTPVPSFSAPPSDPAGADAPAPAPVGLPDDCAQLIAPADLGAVLGLPLDSVEVRSTVGVAEPAVGRTHRLTCRFVGTDAAGRARGATLLDLNAAAYSDAGSAQGQWQVNVDAGAGERSDLPIGAAQGVLFEGSRDASLLVTYAESTLTLILPDRPEAVDRPPGDTLVDLALRALPAVSPPPPNA